MIMRLSYHSEMVIGFASGQVAAFAVPFARKIRIAIGSCQSKYRY